MVGDGSFTSGWDTVGSDNTGNFTYLYQLNGIFGSYEARVYASSWSGNWDESPLASVTFTDGVRLDQCANGDNGEDPECDSSGSTGWINGNVNSNKANYIEGDFLPYRQVIDGLVINNKYCFGMTWDIVRQDLAAIDYIGTFNATLTNADPTVNTIHSGTVNSPDDTIGIPADPALSGTIDPAGPASYTFSGTQQSGELTIWGGTFDSIGPYSNNGATNLVTKFEQSLEYCFTVTDTEVVIAWVGHIARTLEWGTPSLPSGSPYHTANGTKNGQFSSPRNSQTDLACVDPSNNVTHSNIGRQDIQLQAGAVTPLGKVTIVKDAQPSTAVDFTLPAVLSTDRWIPVPGYWAGRGRAACICP